MATRTGTVIRPDGSTSKIEFEDGDPSALQSAVDGYFELIVLDRRVGDDGTIIERTMAVNEDGVARGLTVNTVATEIYAGSEPGRLFAQTNAPDTVPAILGTVVVYDESKG